MLIYGIGPTIGIWYRSEWPMRIRVTAKQVGQQLTAFIVPTIKFSTTMTAATFASSLSLVNNRYRQQNNTITSPCMHTLVINKLLLLLL